MRLSVVACLAVLCSCSSNGPEAKQARVGPLEPPGTATPIKKHPLTKYIELVGFRISESGAAKLRVKFAVVNHSDADIGDLEVKVRLTTSVAKPGQEPITEFEAKVPSLGPEEVKDVTATAPTKLRIYELPDWQFVRAEFEITSPAP